jgi:LysM repeat protein
MLRFLRGLVIVGLLLLVVAGIDTSDDATAILQPQYERTSLPGRDFVYYTVQPDDSLNLVVRKFRVSSVEAILALNPQLEDDRLTAGDRIKIPLQ